VVLQVVGDRSTHFGIFGNVPGRTCGTIDAGGGEGGGGGGCC
jgi:hypothetical protein